jgi:hypothetical protein
MIKTYKGHIKHLKENEVIVVGTNPEGRHGKGSAKWAHDNAGLKYGHSRGLCNQAYGIVTKDLRKRIHPSVPSKDIKNEIKELYEFAKTHPELNFYVAYNSKGPFLSGFTPERMAAMFSCVEIPLNIVFEEGFSKLLNND